MITPLTLIRDANGYPLLVRYIPPDARPSTGDPTEFARVELHDPGAATYEQPLGRHFATATAARVLTSGYTIRMWCPGRWIDRDGIDDLLTFLARYVTDKGVTYLPAGYDGPTSTCEGCGHLAPAAPVPGGWRVVPPRSRLTGIAADKAPAVLCEPCRTDTEAMAAVRLPRPVGGHLPAGQDHRANR